MGVDFADGAAISNVMPKNAVRQSEKRRWPERQVTYDEPVGLATRLLHDDHIREFARSTSVNKFSHLFTWVWCHNKDLESAQQVGISGVSRLSPKKNHINTNFRRAEACTKEGYT